MKMNITAKDREIAQNIVEMYENKKLEKAIARRTKETRIKELEAQGLSHDIAYAMASAGL
ncbi:hypothetical protein [Carnobacterium sp.]|uniref:hypothetical protein n=1 Tax=Carnobacterium sp. TaxID=48221 RepID=UPI00388EF678